MGHRISVLAFIVLNMSPDGPETYCQKVHFLATQGKVCDTFPRELNQFLYEVGWALYSLVKWRKRFD